MGLNERERAIVYFLNKCSEKYNDPDIKKMHYTIKDRGNKNGTKLHAMCYDKRNRVTEKYCGVDWVFYHWPSANIKSFETTKEEIIAASNIPPVINKVGWYGNVNSPKPDVPERKTRKRLKAIGDRHRNLFDIVDVRAAKGTMTVDERGNNYKSMVELMEYKYLIDIGGNGYSGRLKFLLYSKRPTIIIDRNYVEYWHELLEPWVHYIPVKMDLSDLMEKVNWMENNYEKSLEIAENAYKFAIENFTEDKLLERMYYVYNNIKDSNI